MIWKATGADCSTRRVETVMLGRPAANTWARGRASADHPDRGGDRQRGLHATGVRVRELPITRDRMSKRGPDAGEGGRMSDLAYDRPQTVATRWRCSRPGPGAGRRHRPGHALKEAGAPGRLVDPDRANSRAWPGDDGLRKRLVRLADLAADARVQAGWPALAQACALAASPPLRNMGTLGGNLLQDSRCWYFRGPFKCLL
jgi:hypothetical protein